MTEPATHETETVRVSAALVRQLKMIKATTGAPLKFLVDQAVSDYLERKAQEA